MAKRISKSKAVGAAKPTSKAEAKRVAIAYAKKMKGKSGLIVTGHKKLDKLLRHVDTKLAKQVGRKAIRDANKKTLADARANAPVDDGLLKKMIKLRAIKRTRTGFGVLVRIDSKDMPDKPFYPIVQEYGSEKRNIPAVAYMRRAYESNKRRVLKEVIAAMEKGLKKIIRTGGK